MPRRGFDLPFPPPDWEEPKEWRIGCEHRNLPSGWRVTTVTEGDFRLTRFRPCVLVKDASGQGRWNAERSRIRTYVEPLRGSRTLLYYRHIAGPDVPYDVLESYGELTRLYAYLRGGTEAQIEASLRKMFPSFHRHSVAELAEAVWRVLRYRGPWRQTLTSEQRSRYLNRAIKNQLRRLRRERNRREQGHGIVGLREPIVSKRARADFALLEDEQGERSFERMVAELRVNEQIAVSNLNDKERRLAALLMDGYSWTMARRVGRLSPSVETTLRRKLKRLPK